MARPTTTLTALALLLGLTSHGALAAPKHFEATLTKTARGVRVKVPVQSDTANHPRVRVGFLEPSLVTQHNGTHQGRGILDEALGKQSGTHNTPHGSTHTLEFEVDYAAHGLKSGQKARLVSTWQYGNAAQQWHVWGQTGSDTVLP